MCSTVKEAYGGEKARDLFSDTWLGTCGKWDFAARSHPVIHLDMSSVAGPDNDAKMFVTRLNHILQTIGKKLGIKLDQPSPAGNLYDLISELSIKHGKGVVVIIDEYDKPVLDLLHKPKPMESIREALQTFYGVLKSVGGSLEKLLMTGLFKFAQTSMFSTLNNLRDLTFEFAQTSMLNENMSTVDEVVKVLEAKYNGYHFGVDRNGLSESVFNPFGGVQCFGYLQLGRQLLDCVLLGQAIGDCFASAFRCGCPDHREIGYIDDVVWSG